MARCPYKLESANSSNRNIWKGLPFFALAWALLGRIVGRIASIAAGIRRAGERLHEIVELLRDRLDSVAYDVDKAIATAFFSVFVDQTTGDGLGHVGLVQCLGLRESAGISDTAVFGEAGRTSVAAPY